MKKFLLSILTAVASFSFASAADVTEQTGTSAKDNGIWQLVKSSEELTTGSRYIIACTGDKTNNPAAKAISTTNKANNRAATSITPSEDKSQILTPDNTVMTFVLENNGTNYLWKTENYLTNNGAIDETQYYLSATSSTSTKNNDNKLYCKSLSENDMKYAATTVTISDNGDATITFANCKAGKTTDPYTIYYNDTKTSGNLFSSYNTKNNNYIPVQLYKWVETEEAAEVSVVLHGTTEEVGKSISLDGASKRIHFQVADGVEVWHKFVADSESEIALMAETDEDGFTKYDGNGVELSQAGTLSYYTKTANGTKSDVKVLTVNGSTTGISEISAEQGNGADIFDLQGRRVSRATKGIFIVNGKKELRK